MASPSATNVLHQLSRRVTSVSRCRAIKLYSIKSGRVPQMAPSCAMSSQTACNTSQRQYLQKPSWTSLPRTSQRTYFTPSSPEGQLYSPMEEAILSAASTYIPIHGFTHKSLALGAQDAGYLPASTNLFPRGAFELVLYHLSSRRLELKDTVQFPQATEGRKPIGTTQKVKTLLLARLHANKPIHDKLPEALALMSLAGNIPASVKELSLLVDEIWYLAGDISVDSSWYTKRGLLAGVYASSEVFMSQDRSEGFKETETFVQRRLEDVGTVGRNASAIGEWVGFTGAASVNVLRSWGVKI